MAAPAPRSSSPRPAQAGGPTTKTRLRRSILTTTLAAIASVAVLFVGMTPARAEPSVSEIVSQIDKIWSELEPLIEKHAAIKPFVIHPSHEEIEEPTGEFLQTAEEREAFSQFTYCIKCGLCLAACPTVATDPLFLGPQALAQAYRYTADNRDCGLQDRLEAIDAFHGPYQCHLAGACSQACPKGVDPALGIQLLKRTLVLDSIGFGKKKSAVAKVSPLADVVKAIEEFAPPPRTVPQ